MRRAVKCTILAVIMLMVLFSSCTEGKNFYTEVKTEETTEEATEETKEALLTPEELYEGTDLTEEDFADLDVNAFIKQFCITKDSLYGRNVRNCYEMYTEKSAETGEDEYQYLLDSPFNALENTMIDQIKTVYVYLDHRKGEWLVRERILFDFGQNRVCEGCSGSTTLRETTEKDREQMKSLVKEVQLGEIRTNKKAIGLSEEGYEIIIESEDGRIAHYKGEKTLPKKIENFCEEVLAMRSAG